MLHAIGIKPKEIAEDARELGNTLNIMCLYLFPGSDVYYVLLPTIQYTSLYLPPILV